MAPEDPNPNPSPDPDPIPHQVTAANVAPEDSLFPSAAMARMDAACGAQQSLRAFRVEVSPNPYLFSNPNPKPKPNPKPNPNPDPDPDPNPNPNQEGATVTDAQTRGWKSWKSRSPLETRRGKKSAKKKLP